MATNLKQGIEQLKNDAKRPEARERSNLKTIYAGAVKTKKRPRAYNRLNLDDAQRSVNHKLGGNGKEAAKQGVSRQGVRYWKDVDKAHSTKGGK